MVAQMLFISMIILIISGNSHAYGVPYDHSFTNECLVTPLEPQYGGGLVVNPGSNNKLEIGIQFGNTHAELNLNGNGNEYIVASVFWNQEGATHKFQLEKDKLYAFSAWVQASHGNAYVQAMFKTETRNITAGWVAAKEGCWSMLKGGLVVNASGDAELYFKSDNSSTADIRVASISLQPFTHEEWISHRDLDVEKVRKGKAKFQALDQNGRPISNATVTIKQIRPDFPLGCAMNSYTLTNPAYQNWFTSRFKYHTVFENEMRWPYIAVNESYNNYTYLDNLLNFTKSHGLSVRGHPIHTSSLRAQPLWINNTINDTERFRALVNERTETLVERYKGQFFHWDAVNENMHDEFFDDFLGENASTLQYEMVNKIDPKAMLLLNEFYTIEKSDDMVASPWKYLQKIWKMREQGYNGPLGMGVAGRFSEMNLPYIRASLDVLESAKLPLWITELVVSKEAAPHQAEYLEQIMRELYAHKAVDGIMIWAAMWDAGGGCWKMCLTDKHFVNLPTGDVVDKIMAEWTYTTGLHGTTDADGYFETSLYYGDYEANINNHPSDPIKFKVTQHFE